MNQEILKRQYQQDYFYQQQLQNQPQLNLPQQILINNSCQFYNYNNNNNNNNFQQQQQFQLQQQQQQQQYFNYYSTTTDNNNINSTMPNNNSNFIIDNNYSNTLQFTNINSNNNNNNNNSNCIDSQNNNNSGWIYQNNSVSNCSTATNMDQNSNQIQQQQQLYSNNNLYFQFNDSSNTINCNRANNEQIDNLKKSKVENGNYIYATTNQQQQHSFSKNPTYIQNVYNSNHPNLQMAQENPNNLNNQKQQQQQQQIATTQPQINMHPAIQQQQQQQQNSVQQPQQQQQNHHHHHQHHHNIQKSSSTSTTTINQNNNKIIDNKIQYQQKQQIQIQEQKTISNETIKINESLLQEKNLIIKIQQQELEIPIAKDLIDKTLEQQQIQIESKLNEAEREKIFQLQKQHQFNKENHEKLFKKTYLITPKVNEFFPKSLSLENWNFVGETTSRIYQTLNTRADFHKKSSFCRVLLVKKIFNWLVNHDKEYIKSHKTVDLVIAISDIINMIISLIELHRAQSSSILYLIIYSSDRFVERTGINHHQIFNLLLTSAIVNLKFWNESLYIQNKTIADIFSFSVKDLNTMERRFLYGLDYNLCVTPDELNLFITSLKKQTVSSSNFLK